MLLEGRCKLIFKVKKIFYNNEDERIDLEKYKDKDEFVELYEASEKVKMIGGKL